MRFRRLFAASGAAAFMCCCLGIGGVKSAAPVALDTDGSIRIGARKLQCGGVRNVPDTRLPNLGISVPDAKLLVINPMLVARQPKLVRLFVFHHECGHHHVGASEFNADCWAVRRGVRDGWLDKARLAQVCNSFGSAPGHRHTSLRKTTLRQYRAVFCRDNVRHLSRRTVTALEPTYVKDGYFILPS
jgi:hypothetical protein